MIDALSFGLGVLAGLAVMMALGGLLSLGGAIDAHSQYDKTAMGKPAAPISKPVGTTPPPPPGPRVIIDEVRVVCAQTPSDKASSQPSPQPSPSLGEGGSTKIE